MKTKPTKKEREAYKIVGGFGGRALAKKVGSRGMKALGRRGAQKRWKNEKHNS